MAGALTIALGGTAAVVATCVLAVVGAFVVDASFVARARPNSRRTVAHVMAQSVASPYELDTDVARASIERVRQPAPPELVLAPATSAGGTLRSEVTGVHRGEHRLGEAVARVRGPLGLAFFDHRVAEPVMVKVMPDLPKARRMALARRKGGGLDEGRLRNRLGVGTEFELIRDYTPDDDIHQVNWVASARVGRLMSNQYRVDENRDVICALDTGRLMASPVGELTRLDVALDALTVLAVEAESAGDRVGAVAFGSDIRAALVPRRRGAASVVEALYDLEPIEVESDYDMAFASVSRHKRALVVLFSDLVDETVSRSLLEACQVLARRHAIMVVSCRDPDLDAAIDDVPTSTRAVLRASVALEIIRGKNRATAMLRSMGVSVVESPPERLGDATVRAYLALKARAKI